MPALSRHLPGKDSRPAVTAAIAVKRPIAQMGGHAVTGREPIRDLGTVPVDAPGHDDSGLPSAALITRALRSPYAQPARGVRVHDGSAARLAASAVGARAFTYGRHIVLGSAAGPDVFEHELVHVAQQRGVATAADTSLPAAFPVADPQSVLEWHASQHLRSAATPRLHALAVQRAADTAADQHVYTMTLSLPPYPPEQYNNLNAHDATVVLNTFVRRVSSLIYGGQAEQRSIYELRKDQWIVSRVSDVFAFQSPPPMSIWDPVNKSLNSAQEQLAAGRIMDAYSQLLQVADAARKAAAQVTAYKEGTESGAGNAIFTLKIVEGAAATTIAVGTGGAGGVLLGAAYGGVQELAGQATSVGLGLQREIDWAGIGFDVLLSAAMGFASGPLNRLVSARMIGPLVAKYGGTIAIPALKAVVSRVATNVVAGRVGAVIQTAARTAFDELRGKEKVTVEVFLKRLADVITDPHGIVSDIINGEVARGVEALKARSAGASGTPAGRGTPPPSSAKPYPPAVDIEPGMPRPALVTAEPPAPVTPMPAPEPAPVPQPAPEPTPVPETAPVPQPAPVPETAPAAAPESASQTPSSAAATTEAPAAPQKSSSSQGRTVFLDANVLLRVASGNEQLATRLRTLAADPNVRLVTGKGILTEISRAGHITANEQAARQAMIDKLGIEVLDVGLAKRAATYEAYADYEQSPNAPNDPEAFKDQGLAGIKGRPGAKQEARTLEDLPHVAEALIAGAELWTSDDRAQRTMKALGGTVAVESGLDPAGPKETSAENILRLMPEINAADLEKWHQQVAGSAEIADNELIEAIDKQLVPVEGPSGERGPTHVGRQQALSPEELIQEHVFSPRVLEEVGRLRRNLVAQERLLAQNPSDTVLAAKVTSLRARLSELAGQGLEPIGPKLVVPGYGRVNTTAAIQLVDADGNLVAVERGVWHPDRHAEQDAIGKLRARLTKTGVSSLPPGTRMTVAGNQYVCSKVCLPDVARFAKDYGISAGAVDSSVGVRAKMQGSGLASPKTTERTALREDVPEIQYITRPLFPSGFPSEPGSTG